MPKNPYETDETLFAVGPDDTLDSGLDDDDDFVMTEEEEAMAFG